MISLIKLELRKNKVIHDFIMIMVICILMFLWTSNQINTLDQRITIEEFINFFSKSIKNIFMIYCGVLFSKYFISEYKSGTIKNLIGYPVDKSKVFFSKIIIVFTFPIIGTIIVGSILGLVFYLINLQQNIIIGFTLSEFLRSIPYLIYSIIFGLMAMPLAFGIGYGLKSVPTTIFLSVFCTGANQPGGINHFILSEKLIVQILPIIVFIAIISIPIMALVYIGFTKNGV